jgi:hypothetical protein
MDGLIVRVLVDASLLKFSQSHSVLVKILF